MTGRLVTQKGLDLILGADELLAHDAQFVFLGSGEQRYEQALVELAKSAPNRIGVQLDFTDRLEHRLMAGADIFLMPSLYEPCGLTQMRSQRYGAPPIVRNVGGLRDTVEDEVTGFSFEAYTPAAFAEAAFRALDAYADPTRVAGASSAGAWRAISAGSGRSPPTSMSTAARWPGRGDRRADGLRLHAAQPPALRAEPRAVAPRERLDLRGRGSIPICPSLETFRGWRRRARRRR